MTVIINGSTGIDTVQDGIVTDSKLNLTANSAEIKEALNANNGAPIYACRAWVNFNGTGTVAIRASGNVSSITDNDVGDYTVKFTTAMSDGNYATNVTMPYSNSNSSQSGNYFDRGATPTVYSIATSVRVNCFTGSNTGTYYDSPSVNVSIFR